jgi:hypothetical protein
LGVTSICTLRLAGTAGAVADLDAHQAACRVGGGVAVGEVLDHRLHGGHGGRRVEGDDEVAARRAIGDDRADGVPP